MRCGWRSDATRVLGGRGTYYWNESQRVAGIEEVGRSEGKDRRGELAGVCSGAWS